MSTTVELHRKDAELQAVRAELVALRAAHPNFVAAFNGLRGPRSYTASQFVAAFWVRTDPAGECILWRGGADERYGSVSVAGSMMGAHRASVWMATGRKPSPVDSVDHLCRVTQCVNPRHLEVVTSRENTLRGVGPTAINATRTACPAGHEYSDENTRTAKSGKRSCRTCNRERVQRNYWRKRAES